MNRNLLFLLLIHFQQIAFAQQASFMLRGEVKGAQRFKNVFLFDNNYKQIGKQQIANGLFSFSGKYFSEQPDQFGEIGLGTLLLSNLDTITNEESLYPSKPFVRMVIMEPQINVVYLSDSNKFVVNGGKLNEIQNLFYENEFLFKSKRDSAYTRIDLKIKDSLENKKEKKRVSKLLFDEQKLIDFGLIEKNITSKVAIFNFNDFTSIPILPIEKCKTLFESFPDSIKASKYGKHTLDLMNELDNLVKPTLKLTDRMPVFKLNNTNNKSVKSTDCFGKYTLIDFWANWCAPCRSESPNLKLSYQKYHKKGFNIISISIDAEKDKAKWLGAIRVDKTQDFINLIDPNGATGIAKELKINAIPANYLIDSKGKIIGLNLRGVDLQKKLNELFRK